MEKFLPEGMSGERIAHLLVLPAADQSGGASVGLLSSDGRFKWLPLEKFQELSGRASSVLKLKEGGEPAAGRALPRRQRAGGGQQHQPAAALIARRNSGGGRARDRWRQRGDIGQIGLRFSERGDQLVDLGDGTQPLLAGLLSDGRTLRLDTAELQAEDDTGSGQEQGTGGNEAVTELMPLLS